MSLFRLTGHFLECLRPPLAGKPFGCEHTRCAEARFVSRWSEWGGREPVTRLSVQEAVLVEIRSPRRRGKNAGSGLTSQGVPVSPLPSVARDEQGKEEEA